MASPGYTFDPTDEQLVGFLKDFKNGLPTPDTIPDIADCFYKTLPENLVPNRFPPGITSPSFRNFYFVTRNRSNRDETKCDHTVKLSENIVYGSWEEEDFPDIVETNEDDEIVAYKTEFVYYDGHSAHNRKRTLWGMDEYIVTEKKEDAGFESIALCVVFIKLDEIDSQNYESHESEPEDEE